MGLLDRYRKKGGFIALVALLESSPPVKQEKFLTLIREESPSWETELRKKMLSLERIAKWPATTLMELFTRIPILPVATAIFPWPQKEREVFLTALGPRERRQIEHIFTERNTPAPAEVLTSQILVITDIRGLLNAGTVKLEQFAPELAIPANIEDQLLLGGFSTAGAEDNDNPAVSTGELAQNASSTVNVDELEVLRRKIARLNEELEHSRHENHVLKGKLEQIRKIA